MPTTEPESWTRITLTLADKELMLASADRRYNSELTKAGRELGKHPNIVGIECTPDRSSEALRSRFGSERGRNLAALNAVKALLDEGTAHRRAHPRYGAVIDVKVANGLGARFLASGLRFEHFLGRND